MSASVPPPAYRPDDDPTQLWGGVTRYYRRVMDLLDAAGVPFLVGGGYTFWVYTGILRPTKDFDLFLPAGAVASALAALGAAGLRAGMRSDHWLAKAEEPAPDGACVDLVFASGNGVCRVEPGWFDHAPVREVFGRSARLCPAEETLWMKAYIMERERFDGADVAHLILRAGPGLDWERLLRRFGPDWRLLLAHVTLFDFFYPDPAAARSVPAAVRADLRSRLPGSHGEETTAGDPAAGPLCRGPLVSRAQFLPDLRQGGCHDARRLPRVGLSPAQIEAWTAEIGRGE